MPSLKDKQAITIIEKYKLNNQESTTLTDDNYLVTKLSDNVRLMYRKSKNEKCTLITDSKQSVPEGAQSFAFAKVKVSKAGQESVLDLMVPSVFLSAPTKSTFPIIIKGGFATFKDRPMTKEEVATFLSDQVAA